MSTATTSRQGRRPAWSGPALAAAVAITALALLVAGCHGPLDPAAPLGHPLRYMDLMRAPMPERLPVPVEGVAAARLVDSWGAARDGGRGHQGIDVFAPRNTPVRRATDGIVEWKGMRGLGGQVVNVVGPGGYRHYYAHLEDFGPQQPGDWVS